MAMIEMKGQIINIYKANDSLNRETGERRIGAIKLQIMGKMPLESGESQLQMHDLSCREPDSFKPYANKWVSFPIGIMSSENNTILYIPKGAKPVEIDPKAA